MNCNYDAMFVITDSFRNALDILCLVYFLFGKENVMKSANGTTVIVKSYPDGDAEEIVHLIVRNFKEMKFLGKSCRKYFTNYFCAAGIS